MKRVYRLNEEDIKRALISFVSSIDRPGHEEDFGLDRGFVRLTYSPGDRQNDTGSFEAEVELGPMLERSQ